MGHFEIKVQQQEWHGRAYQACDDSIAATQHNIDN